MLWGKGMKRAACLPSGFSGLVVPGKGKFSFPWNLARLPWEIHFSLLQLENKEVLTQVVFVDLVVQPLPEQMEKLRPALRQKGLMGAPSKLEANLSLPGCCCPHCSSGVGAARVCRGAWPLPLSPVRP